MATLSQKQAKEKELTDQWTEKWSETHTILQEQKTLGLRKAGMYKFLFFFLFQIWIFITGIQSTQLWSNYLWWNQGSVHLDLLMIFFFS